MVSGALVGTVLLRPLGMWVPLVAAACLVAGLASYLYLSERSTTGVSVQIPLSVRNSPGRLQAP